MQEASPFMLELGVACSHADTSIHAMQASRGMQRDRSWGGHCESHICTAAV